MAWPAEEYRTLWEGYERSNAVSKQRAEKALAALLAFQELQASGIPIGVIEPTVAAQHGITRVTLWNYRRLVKGHPQEHWLPLLAPKYLGRGKQAEFSEPAYEWILARYLSTSAPKGEVIVKEARQEALKHGWHIPSTKTVLRRLAQEPAWLHKLGRQGAAALERSFPAVERDYASLGLHELWESDGRRADVFCVWPDGTIARPFIVVWREVRTRLVLSAKGYLNPTGELVMACYRMALERTNAKPAGVKLDNGREYANKAFTGQQKTRYRFQVKPDEPIGALTHMGTKVHWSKPGRGQDKPVESFWRYVADHCDKAPEFQGAYCGRNPVEKPEDFDRRKAIPIEAYGIKLATVLEEFNRRPHRGQGMGGRSPYDLYAELITSAVVHQPDPAHLRLLLQGVNTLKLQKDDASIRFKIEGYGLCRYWSDALADLPLSARQKQYQVYFDPENPDAKVAVYDGLTWICDAERIERIDFLAGGEEAAAHSRTKHAHMAPKKQAVKRIKAKAPLALPDMSKPPQLTPIPQPSNALLIEAPRYVTKAAEPERTLEPLDNEANAWRNKLTGEIHRKPVPAKPAPTGMRTQADLAELKRQRDEAKEKEALERKRRLGQITKAA
ncbi:hypothetical protein GCM10027296_43670 [Chitinimonas naiadis]